MLSRLARWLLGGGGGNQGPPGYDCQGPPGYNSLEPNQAEPAKSAKTAADEAADKGDARVEYTEWSVMGFDPGYEAVEHFIAKMKSPAYRSGLVLALRAFTDEAKIPRKSGGLWRLAVDGRWCPTTSSECRSLGLSRPVYVDDEECGAHTDPQRDPSRGCRIVMAADETAMRRYLRLRCGLPPVDADEQAV